MVSGRFSLTLGVFVCCIDEDQHVGSPTSLSALTHCLHQVHIYFHTRQQRRRRIKHEKTNVQMYEVIIYCYF